MLRYDAQMVEFDDRLLAHLQIVVVLKLRRGDAFLMSWLNSLSIGDGRSSIWLERTMPLRFNFAGSRSPQINAVWLQTLQRSADSATGLLVTGEDGQLVRSNNRR